MMESNPLNLNFILYTSETNLYLLYNFIIYSILWSTGQIPQNKCNTIKSNDGRKFDRFNSHHSAWQYTAKQLKMLENRA